MRYSETKRKASEISENTTGDVSFAQGFSKKARDIFRYLTPVFISLYKKVIYRVFIIVKSPVQASGHI